MLMQHEFFGQYHQLLTVGAQARPVPNHLVPARKCTMAFSAGITALLKLVFQFQDLASTMIHNPLKQDCDRVVLQPYQVHTRLNKLKM